MIYVSDAMFTDSRVVCQLASARIKHQNHCETNWNSESMKGSQSVWNAFDGRKSMFIVSILRRLNLQIFCLQALLISKHKPPGSSRCLKCHVISSGSFVPTLKNSYASLRTQLSLRENAKLQCRFQPVVVSNHNFSRSKTYERRWLVRLGIVCVVKTPRCPEREQTRDFLRPPSSVTSDEGGTCYNKCGLKDYAK